MRDTAMSAVLGVRLGRVATLGLVATLLGCMGCESAHYVMRNPDRGAVAIPEDTPALRAKAEKLMHDQFPGGYVIDDVRVVVYGHHHGQEVMLSYHSAEAPTPAGGAPVVPVGTSPNPYVVPHVQPALLTQQQGGLPPQPVPVNP
jgi:hypothetical protein